MQIGVRWRAGETPHPRVPSELHEAIATVDRDHQLDSSWTLTWLEGRPRCERADGYLVLLNAAHSVEVIEPSYDEDDGDDDDDNDDWLEE